MDKKIRSLIKALERQYGSPVQISLERPKETEVILCDDKEHLLFPTERAFYGSFESRPCQVLALPTNDQEIQHDLNLIIGKYTSLKDLDSALHDIPEATSFCVHAMDFHEGLRNHLTEKYAVQKAVVGIAHGGKADWYVVDGVEADLHDWRSKRPDLFDESLRYLKNNNISFRYHDLTATPRGVYITKLNDFHYFEEFKDYLGTEETHSLLLKQKIAEIKLELLK
ncbi:MAG: hypothetical protein Q8R47_02535 [Nanoarchaeota archaeon]|nr:hypothetical protein [Nanoarchaeota archaeon]